MLIHNKSGEILSGRTSAHRHLRGEVPLHDYFNSEEDASTILAGIHHKVVGVMLSAQHPKTGQNTGRDNYICGLDDHVESLTRYVMGRIRGLDRVFGHEHMPKHEVYLTRQQWKSVIDRLHYQMVTSILLIMRDDNNLYRMDSDWMFSNVIRIEHDRHNREMQQSFRNDHTFHGRPSKQGRQRAKGLRTGVGVSIGALS